MEDFVALYIFKASSVGVQVKKLFVILQDFMFSWFPSSGFCVQIQNVHKNSLMGTQLFKHFLSIFLLSFIGAVTSQHKKLI